MLKRVKGRVFIVAAALAALLAGLGIMSAGQEPVMVLRTVAYKHEKAGLIYTLYDEKSGLKVTSADYELPADPQVTDRSYFGTAPIFCSISRTTPKAPNSVAAPDGQVRPAKIYQGVKARYKTDGAVYSLYLENGDVYEGCDATKWNHNLLGPPQRVD